LYNSNSLFIFWADLSSDGSGSKFFDPGWVRSIFCGSGRVSHLRFVFEFGKFPLKTSIFSIFFTSDQKKSFRIGSKSTRVKGGSASYLLQVKSKLGSGPVWSGPISRPISFEVCYSIIYNSFLNFHNHERPMMPFSRSSQTCIIIVNKSLLRINCSRWLSVIICPFNLNTSKVYQSSLPSISWSLSGILLLSLSDFRFSPFELRYMGR